MNRYGYTGNNPANGADPLGLDWRDGAKVAIAAWSLLSGSLGYVRNFVQPFVTPIIQNAPYTNPQIGNPVENPAQDIAEAEAKAAETGEQLEKTFPDSAPEGDLEELDSLAGHGPGLGVLTLQLGIIALGGEAVREGIDWSPGHPTGPITQWGQNLGDALANKLISDPWNVPIKFRHHPCRK